MMEIKFNSSLAKLSAITLTTIALLGVADRAHAFNVSGTSSGSWELPVPQDRSGYEWLSNQNSGTNNRLTWGVGAPGSFSNYVQYDGVNFNSGLNSLFNLGNLSYRNGSTYNTFAFDSGKLDADIPLKIALSLASPSPITLSFNFLFNILSTPNVTGNPVLDGDRLRFSMAGLTSQTLNYGGIAYTMKLMGFSSDGGKTVVSEFNSPEGTTATASLYGQISGVELPAEPVPEPVTLMGSALGLLGLRLASGRRSKNTEVRSRA
jgi:hypothetical protein